MDNFFISFSYSPLNETLCKYKNIYAVVDSNVHSLYSSWIRSSFNNIYVFESNETAKSFESTQKIIQWLLENNADRSSLLVGVGGGITTDLCGFVASIYKRGITFGLIPTTLTAQIDASIGGKTGININGIKNAAGTFSKAEFIYINPHFLRTLPHREFLCGWAELIKTFIIGDKKYFLTASLLTDSVSNGEIEISLTESLNDCLKRAIEIKSGIVEKDRFENEGIRAYLNLGHTFGHAIEACCHFFSPQENICNHGEAVAAGILIAARFSLLKGVLPIDEYKAIKQVITESGLPSCSKIMKLCKVDSTKIFTEKLLHFIGNDKKCKEDFINFVFIIDLGKVITMPTSIAEIERYIHDLCYD